LELYLHFFIIEKSARRPMQIRSGSTPHFTLDEGAIFSAIVCADPQNPCGESERCGCVGWYCQKGFQLRSSRRALHWTHWYLSIFRFYYALVLQHGRREIVKFTWHNREMKKFFLKVVICFSFCLPAMAQGFSEGQLLTETTSVGERLSLIALERTRQNVIYDPSYVRLAYPGGDVPQGRGVCADVVIRVLRGVGLDLQRLVHEDMKSNFSVYPALWGLSRPDRNIDHRRVPNIEVYLTRRGAKLEPSRQPEDYRPGDIVAWNLRGDAGFLPHIGVVTDQIGTSGWPMVVHNINAGPQLEDVLFAWPMTGRYRINTSRQN